MGRIAEALRRAGLNPQGQTGVEARGGQDLTTYSGGEVILAPWDVGDCIIAEAPLLRATVAPAAVPPNTKPAKLQLSFGDGVAQRVVASRSMDAVTREQYSKLASALHQAQTERGVKVVMVTSTLPQEGKTLTTINLALTLSESYSRQVLVIDADLRAPSLDEAFCLEPEPGLQDGLLDDWRRVVRRVHPHLVVMPAGRASNDPMGVFTLGAMRQMLDDARNEFDWILLDTPPVGLLPDANFLAALVDSVIVVVRAGKTRYDLVQRAVGEIGLERIFGVVLNSMESVPAAYAPYHAAYLKPSLKR